MKASTRAELARRLRLAADFIRSHHDEPLTVSTMAGVASMSPFHFVRYFRMLHGATPHAYLVARRAEAASRLLSAGDTDLDRVALRSGFGSRSSLRRALARQAG